MTRTPNLRTGSLKNTAYSLKSKKQFRGYKYRGNYYFTKSIGAPCLKDVECKSKSCYYTCSCTKPNQIEQSFLNYAHEKQIFNGPQGLGASCIENKDCISKQCKCTSNGTCSNVFLTVNPCNANMTYKQCIEKQS